MSAQNKVCYQNFSQLLSSSESFSSTNEVYLNSLSQILTENPIIYNESLSFPSENDLKLLENRLDSFTTVKEAKSEGKNAKLLQFLEKYSERKYI